jgi:hypothetical protein
LIVPRVWSEVLDFFGTPLVIEPSPGQAPRDAGLLPFRQFDQRIGLTQAFIQAFDDPRDAELTRVPFARASARTNWQQNGNNIGRVCPTCLQRSWQKNGDVTICRTSILTVSPTCFLRPVCRRRTGLKIRSLKCGCGFKSHLRHSKAFEQTPQRLPDDASCRPERTSWHDPFRRSSRKFRIARELSPYLRRTIPGRSRGSRWRVPCRCHPGRGQSTFCFSKIPSQGSLRINLSP